MLKEHYIFEWALIKSDEFGNPIAIKKLGTGFYKDVIIPQNYEDYRLMLTAINKKTRLSQNDISVLSTPSSS